MNQLAQFDDSKLVLAVERARALLDDGDVTTARVLAGGAYEHAKAAAQFASRYAAVEELAGPLIKKARMLQGEALLIEAQAKIRLAAEWTVAQESGTGLKGRPKSVPDAEHFSVADTGLTRKEMHEARKLASAEQREPGIVERAIEARLSAGLEPSRANLRAAIGTDSATAAERGNNLYETPPEAMRTLLSFTRFAPNVWEPACGKGAISRMLEDVGYQVELSDLIDYSTADRHGEVQRVENFLASAPRCEDPGRPDIVTNPPYGTDLNAFVAHALRAHRPRRMALLLNLNFLCGFDDPDRCFAMDENPPSDVWVFTRRLPMMHRDGWDGPEASSRMNTAWFVWTLDETTGTYDADGKRGTQLVRVDWKTFQESTLIGPTTTNPVAKASEDNGGTSAIEGAPMTGEVSRGEDVGDRQLPSSPGLTGDRRQRGGGKPVSAEQDHAPLSKRGRPRKAAA
ncbi:SAM-dependent methyltransferase [Mesorhizobium sp. M0130]|uniref:SAM-dependent methyltransferase n=1 Tax=Mesorhizobium sp. M0130 TaxID=2956887 RepID=UPI003334C152